MREIRITEENLADIVKQGLDLLPIQQAPSDEQIEEWLTKNWDSNWYDSRCFEDELRRLKKFVREIFVGRQP